MTIQNKKLKLKLNLFPGKVSQILQNGLNVTFIMGNIHNRKRFRSYLEVKSVCSECLEMAYFNFLYVLEWRSWKCLLERQGKALESEFGHSTFFIKWFGSYLDVKNVYFEGCDCSKISFAFLEMFKWRRWNYFLGKQGKALKMIWI